MAENGVMALERAAFVAGFKVAFADQAPWAHLGEITSDYETEQEALAAWNEHAESNVLLQRLQMRWDGVLALGVQAGGLAGLQWPG